MDKLLVPCSELLDAAGQPVKAQERNVLPELTAYSSEEEFRAQHLTKASRDAVVDLKSLINPNCPKCYGRGFTGIKQITAKPEDDKQYIYCSCLLKAYSKRVQDIKRQRRPEDEAALVKAVR